MSRMSHNTISSTRKTASGDDAITNKSSLSIRGLFKNTKSNNFVEYVKQSDSENKIWVTASSCKTQKHNIVNRTAHALGESAMRERWMEESEIWTPKVFKACPVVVPERLFQLTITRKHWKRYWIVENARRLMEFSFYQVFWPPTQNDSMMVTEYVQTFCFNILIWPRPSK